MDHTGTLGHAGQTVGSTGGGRQSERSGEELGEGIGGADGAGSAEPGIVSRGQIGVRGWDLVEDLVNGKSIDNEVFLFSGMTLSFFHTQEEDLHTSDQ